jgi:hypothetical protein
VNETLNRAREKSGMVVQDNLTERNNIVTMVLGGSKVQRKKKDGIFFFEKLSNRETKRI